MAKAWSFRVSKIAEEAPTVRCFGVCMHALLNDGFQSKSLAFVQLRFPEKACGNLSRFELDRSGVDRPLHHGSSRDEIFVFGLCLPSRSPSNRGPTNLERAVSPQMLNLCKTSFCACYSLKIFGGSFQHPGKAFMCISTTAQQHDQER